MSIRIACAMVSLSGRPKLAVIRGGPLSEHLASLKERVLLQSLTWWWPRCFWRMAHLGRTWFSPPVLGTASLRCFRIQFLAPRRGAHLTREARGRMQHVYLDRVWDSLHPALFSTGRSWRMLNPFFCALVWYIHPGPVSFA